MTREEAIAELKRYIGSDGTVPEELKMAISALEHHDEFMKRSYEQGKADALSQEPCSDAISREQVLSCFINWHIRGAESVIDEIRELPSVTQKSGYWIETEYHRWRCSVCREKGMSEWDNIHAVRTNFCPDCGARMESEDKE